MPPNAILYTQTRPQLVSDRNIRMDRESTKVFAAIDLAVRVSQYMRNCNLIPDMLEYQLRGFLDERKRSPDIPPDYMFLLGHVKSLCVNYDALRRHLTPEDEVLLRDVIAIEAPRIEDRVAWDRIEAMMSDAGNAPPRISFDKITRDVLELANRTQTKREQRGQTLHSGLERCVNKVMTTSDCWPELRSILLIAEDHGIDVEDLLRYQIILPHYYEDGFGGDHCSCSHGTCIRNLNT